MAWEPPHRLVISWQVNPNALAATDVDVTFAAAGDGRTEVRIEHRGWELLADPAASRASYDEGWDGLGSLRRVAFLSRAATLAAWTRPR
jgi:uncharacterized protein YndB with AHSA1/START domain